MGANRSLKQWWLVGVLLSLVVVWSSWSANAKGTIEPRAVSSRGGLTDDEQSTIRVFENNSPSVVFITTVERVLDVWTRNVSEVPSGTGSGFLWDEEGHIVTNNHVVEGHRTAKVRLSDQQTFDAVVVGTSPEHDLAVLKLQSVKDMPQPVQIGSSNDLKVGQKVLAIGNPFGLDHTLTSGIISALNRSIDGENGKGMEGLIQTDAAINPGNSGGPLLDSAGRLIGVNVAIYSPSGASAGIGFAIPVDTVNRVVPRLIKDGRYTRPVLGVTSEDSVSQRITEKLGTFGLLVLKVSSRSPAEQAGLRGTQITPNGELILGDIIQSIDGKEIRSVDDLSSVLDAYPANSTVRIHLLRDGKTAVDLTVELSLLR